jgi:hypothetical protein
MITDMKHSGVMKLTSQGNGRRNVCLKTSVISVSSVAEN